MPKRKKEITLLLDLGTEAIKTLIFQTKEEKIEILSSSLEYFDTIGEGLKKAILKSLQNLGLENLGAKKDLSVILGLPANILKGRVVSQNFKRKEPKKIITGKEEKLISTQVLERAKGKISQIYSQGSGILPQDTQFINLKILKIEIDGYKVSGLQGYQGRDLDFGILATFSASDYLKEIENICRAMNFKQKKIFHEAEGLNYYLKEIPEGIFLDVGGELSQIFLVKKGQLERIDELESGGEIFSRAISETLGLREKDSRILKERYSKKELSKESEERIKKILGFPAQTWLENLKLQLKKMSPDGLLPPDVILFGGGSQLPEIKNILETENWENFAFSTKPNIKIFQPADFKDFEIKTEELNSPQNIPALLLCRASWERASD